MKVQGKLDEASR